MILSKSVSSGSLRVLHGPASGRNGGSVGASPATVPKAQALLTGHGTEWPLGKCQLPRGLAPPSPVPPAALTPAGSSGLVGVCPGGDDRR